MYECTYICVCKCVPRDHLVRGYSQLTVCLRLLPSAMVALANRANLSISALLHCLQHAYGQLYLNMYFLKTLFYCFNLYIYLSSSNSESANTLFSVALMAFPTPN